MATDPRLASLADVLFELWDLREAATAAGQTDAPDGAKEAVLREISLKHRRLGEEGLPPPFFTADLLASPPDSARVY